jgi:putative acetyltransferase
VQPTGVVIRWEKDVDQAAIRRVNQAAFGTSEEADLVDALRTDGMVLRSAVAEADGDVVGHVLFSRMWIDTAAAAVDAVALAPVGVVPSHQRQGIGDRLIRFGLAALREDGEAIVLVVGHPPYYPRFGFSTALAAAIESPFPADAFMALELVSGALDGVRGRVRYPAAFGV